MPGTPAFADLALAAETHLTAACPTLGPLVTKVGRCTLQLEPDVFAAIVRAVVAQLISTAAAKTITARLVAALKGKVVPARVLALDDETIRACGLSRAKVKTIRGVAELFAARRGLSKKLIAGDEAFATDTLLPLHGIGPWTVDMIRIFSLGHTDVLPVGDLGVRAAVQELFRFKDMPDAKSLTTLAEPWRPYRSIASWYLWRSRGFVPQSDG